MHRAVDASTLRLLARGIVHELRKQDYRSRHIVALANELIGLAHERARLPKKPM